MASVPADGSGGVAFGPIDADSLGELRMLNDTTFPVRYNERFYAEVLTTRLEHTKYGACVREALMDGWMDRRCAMSLTGCRFRILLTPPLSRIAAARPAYWRAAWWAPSAAAWSPTTCQGACVCSSFL
jgi:hypothetical protein